MAKDRIFELLSKRSARELTLEEHIELNRLLEEDVDIQVFETILNDFMSTSTNYEESVSENEVEDFIKRVHGKIDRDARDIRHFQLFSNWKKISAIAASLLIIATGVVLYLYQRGQRGTMPTFPNVVATQKGNKTNIVLPDGTKVWVNADSRLTYEQSFGRNTREVVLTGEAYFDVVHDQNRPFIVHTSNIDVRVFGTAFNVRSYSDESTTQTTLFRGSVQVSLKNGKDKKIMLAPNEKLVVQNSYSRQQSNSNSENLPQIELLMIKPNPRDSLVAEISWVNNKLVFDRERLEQIVPTLERWYNVKIILKNRAISKTFSGVFQNDSLEEVLKSLQLSAGIEYKIEKDLITIY